MIIFLYGPDTYRSRQKLREIINHYKKIHQSGLNLKFFDSENLDFLSLKNEFETQSIFKEKKLFVLNDLFSRKDLIEDFFQFKEKFLNSKDIILIYERNKIEKGKSLFNFLKEKTINQFFDLLPPEKLRFWLKRELEKYQWKIEERALEKLIEFVGNNLWQMANELKKLITFCLNRPSRKITLEDVEILLKPEIKPSIFQAIDAISRKDKKRAIFLFHQTLEKGDSPFYLFSMINFQFRNLLLLKTNQMKKEEKIIRENLKIHPYIIKKTIGQLKKFSFPELRKIYQKIFQLDLEIKTGKINPALALDIFVSQV